MHPRAGAMEPAQEVFTFDNHADYGHRSWMRESNPRAQKFTGDVYA